MANAVILGSSTINVNADLSLLLCISSFGIEDELSGNFGSSFATRGALDAGLQLLLEEINRGLMMFGMVVSGGGSWLNSEGSGVVVNGPNINNATLRACHQPWSENCRSYIQNRRYKASTTTTLPTLCLHRTLHIFIFVLAWCFYLKQKGAEERNLHTDVSGCTGKELRNAYLLWLFFYHPASTFFVLFGSFPTLPHSSLRSC